MYSIYVDIIMHTMFTHALHCSLPTSSLPVSHGVLAAPAAAAEID